MEFEFDAKKSARNKEKHGVDFVEAQLMWEDKNEVSYQVLVSPESRFLRLVRYKRKIWAIVYTIREPNIRLISVRRARKDEEKIYGQDKEH